MHDVDAPFQLAEYNPPDTSGMASDEAEVVWTDLDQWKPSYWKEPHVIAVLTAAVKDLISRVEELEGKL